MVALVKSTPRTVCILGMHRSGTSAVARLLNLAGVYLGAEEAISATGADNPTGFWEHRDFREINNQLLERFGGSWREPPDFPSGWEGSAELAELRERAENLVGTFSGVQLWGFKDPRTSLTLPFWLPLLDSACFVICVRSPLSVAASLTKRDGLSTEDSLRLWRRYTTEALTHAHPSRRVVVHVERLFSDWEMILSQIIETFGLRGMRRPRQIRASVSDFLRESLWHHRNSARGVVSSAEVNPATAALYLLLRDLQANDPTCSRLYPKSLGELGDDVLLRMALFYAWTGIAPESADQSSEVFHGPLTSRLQLKRSVESKDVELAGSRRRFLLLQNQLQLVQETLQNTRVQVEFLEAEIEQLRETEEFLRETLENRTRELSVLRQETLATHERELEAVRRQLATRREELHRIKTSRWWRLMDRYWRLRRFVAGTSKQ